MHLTLSLVRSRLLFGSQALFSLPPARCRGLLQWNVQLSGLPSDRDHLPGLSKDDSPHLLTSLAWELLAGLYKQDYHIYTDVSVLEDGSTGVGEYLDAVKNLHLSKAVTKPDSDSRTTSTGHDQVPAKDCDNTLRLQILTGNTVQGVLQVATRANIYHPRTDLIPPKEGCLCEIPMGPLPRRTQRKRTS